MAAVAEISADELDSSSFISDDELNQEQVSEEANTTTQEQTMMFSIQTASAKRNLVISLIPSATQKEAIYAMFVAGTSLRHAGAKSKSSYHITVAWIKGVEQRHYKGLEDALNRVKNAFFPRQFSAKEVKRYQVNRPDPHNTPLVIFPRIEEHQKLKVLNENLFSTLIAYNNKHGTRYEFVKDCVPGLFTPHITLIDAKSINDRGLFRDSIIRELNKKIDEKGFPRLECYKRLQ